MKAMKVIFLFCLLGTILFGNEAIVEMAILEQGYIPADTLHFFQFPLINAQGEDVEISTIIDPEMGGKYIVSVSSPDL